MPQRVKRRDRKRRQAAEWAELEERERLIFAETSKKLDEIQVRLDRVAEMLAKKDEI